ncbi:30S ribosomal protein S3 [Candidatus Micrarchaeota archaeon]|nr:30S ribosomal protein S3 [Candidatus Micrarchaeota archaeon]MBU1165953.1 30S ribosomal protein S3 [Candidatus Micrarchaeota archaeon]MBU1886857.1 30S ribosomal protein S3 [Candidatus Micrarchaeota archaeon]
MLYQEKLIEEPFSKYQVMKFLEKKLDRAGLANVDIQRTPLVTRITLEVTNPARIIGRKGRLINELTDSIKKEFNIENPQVSVVEVREPFLEPRMVAKRAARYIEMGKKVRSVLHYMLREVIRAGALGAEIVAAGKIGAKGARAKTLRVSAGYIPKAGEPVRLLRRAHITANTRSGVIGVLVRIAPPGTVFPDKKTAIVVLPKVIEAATGVSKDQTAGKSKDDSQSGRKRTSGYPNKSPGAYRGRGPGGGNQRRGPPDRRGGRR